MNHTALIAKLRKLLAENELAAVNQILLQVLAQSPLLDDAIQQSGRFTAIQKNLRKGLIDSELADAKVNRIRFALLELVRHLETEGVKEGLQLVIDEMEDLGQQANYQPHLELATQHFNQQAEKIYNISHIDQANFS